MNPHALFIEHEDELRDYAAQWTKDMDAAMQQIIHEAENHKYPVTLGDLYHFAFISTLAGRQPTWNKETADWLKLAIEYGDVGYGDNVTAEELATYLAGGVGEYLGEDEHELADEFYGLDWLKVDWLAIATVVRLMTKDESAENLLPSSAQAA